MQDFPRPRFGRTSREHAFARESGCTGRGLRAARIRRRSSDPPSSVGDLGEARPSGVAREGGGGEDGRRLRCGPRGLLRVRRLCCGPIDASVHGGWFAGRRAQP